MNALLRDVLSSGWTVAGATVAWLAVFAVGIVVRFRQRRGRTDEFPDRWRSL